MKILITGATGMLGFDLCKELLPMHEVFGLARGEHPVAKALSAISFMRVDVVNGLSVTDALTRVKPDIVLHAAAYTDVDGCESNSQLAYQINAQGTENVAHACRDVGARMLYISTDYVFDGEKGAPYDEEDVPNPVNVYGRSKLRGEEYLKAILDNYIIVRTSWLYGKNGRNFVEGVADCARRGVELRIVNDQFGSPTWTADLAGAIAKLIESVPPSPVHAESREWLRRAGRASKCPACHLAGRQSVKDLSGVYHITNSGSCSRYEEAVKALEYAGLRAAPASTPCGARVVPIASSESGRPAKRPKNSVLENKRYRGIFGETLRPWDEALEDYLSACGAQAGLSTEGK